MIITMLKKKMVANESITEYRYNLKEIPKTNLYIKISYNDDTSEIINLNIEKKYTNNTVFPKKVDEIASDDNNDDN